MKQTSFLILVYVSTIALISGKQVCYQRLGIEAPKEQCIVAREIGVFSLSPDINAYEMNRKGGLIYYNDSIIVLEVKDTTTKSYMFRIDSRQYHHDDKETVFKCSSLSATASPNDYITMSIGYVVETDCNVPDSILNKMPSSPKVELRFGGKGVKFSFYSTKVDSLKSPH